MALQSGFIKRIKDIRKKLEVSSWEWADNVKKKDFFSKQRAMPELPLKYCLINI